MGLDCPEGAGRAATRGLTIKMASASAMLHARRRTGLPEAKGFLGLFSGLVGAGELVRDSFVTDEDVDNFLAC